MNSTILCRVAALSLALHVHAERFENYIRLHPSSSQLRRGRNRRRVWGRRAFPTCLFLGPLMGQGGSGFIAVSYLLENLAVSP